MCEVTRIEDGFVVGIAAPQLHSTPGFRPEIIPNNYNLPLVQEIKEDIIYRRMNLLKGQ
jgi:hypothetical protein